MGTVLSRDKGERAVELARDSMRSYVVDGKRERPGCMKDVFYERVGAAVRLNSTRGRRRVRGSGVSYKRDKHLSQSIVDAVIEASDSCEGTSEVNRCELDSVTLTLCVLSSVEEVGEDAVDVCEVGKHGVIVESGRDTGWMLPTVPVERGWTATELLDRTCRKSGIDHGCWRDDSSKSTVYLFEGQVFREQKPGGEVKEVELVASV
ncbi:MAG: TIGR00296 family protein [Halobacteriales archaeon]|nr:TIGR00296 family protein [Halobacteriales archaeon]